jgi:hypothetical protein
MPCCRDRRNGSRHSTRGSQMASRPDCHAIDVVFWGNRGPPPNFQFGVRLGKAHRPSWWDSCPSAGQ